MAALGNDSSELRQFQGLGRQAAFLDNYRRHSQELGAERDRKEQRFTELWKERQELLEQQREAVLGNSEVHSVAGQLVSPVSPVSGANPVVGQSVASGSTALSVLGVLDRGDGDGSAAAPNGRAGSVSSASSVSAMSLRYRYSSASSPGEATDTSDAFMAGTASDTAAAPTLAVGRHGPQTEAIPDTPDTRNGTAPMPSPVPMTATSPATSPDDSGCTPTTSLLRFDGGYEVSMCYRTPDTPDGTEGVEGQAKAGLYASAESGLLWFFSRDNAEVLVKVLNGCAINGYRWVFVAPVTTLEFDLQVTSPTGARWTHTNTQGVTAATKSDVAAFACADEPEATPDLIVSDVTVSDATPVAGQTITLRAAVRNRGDGPASPTTLRFYRSSDSTISASDNSDVSFASEAVAALAALATESRTFQFRSPSTPGTFYLGACIDSVAAESRTGNNCSTGVRVVVDDDPDEFTWISSPCRRFPPRPRTKARSAARLRLPRRSTSALASIPWPASPTRATTAPTVCL